MRTSFLSLVALAGACSAHVGQRANPPELTTVEVQLAPPQQARSFRVRNSAPTTERISYFEANGLAIVHGDVIYATVDEIKAKSVQKRAFSLFTTQTSSLWTGGQVHYKWQSEDAKGLGRLESWTEGTQRWMNMLSFLQFIEHPANATLVDDIVTLVPTLNTGGCFSPIGKAPSLWANQIMLDNDCGGAGTYTHEIGHTLGLRHEHQRPDRDTYVTVNCSNVWQSPPGTPADCSQDHCLGYGCNFVKLDPSAADYSGPYDSLSLMHYAPYEFASGGPAIVANPGVPQPQPHTYPTVLDAKRVCDLFAGSCTGVCGNGILEPGEECDDGNNWDGDGCSANCKKEGNTSSASSTPSTPSSTPISTPSSTPVSTPSSTPVSPPQSTSTPVNPPPQQSTSTPSTPSTPTTPTISSSTPTSTPGTCLVPSCSLSAVSGCDITTTCTVLGGATQAGKGQHMCACRAGYRASGYAANDTSVQVRLPWDDQKGRVFVKPGVVCDQLCDAYWLGKGACGEVVESRVCY